MCYVLHSVIGRLCNEKLDKAWEVSFTGRVISSVRCNTKQISNDRSVVLLRHLSSTEVVSVLSLKDRSFLDL